MLKRGILGNPDGYLRKAPNSKHQISNNIKILIFEKPKLPRSLGLGYFYFEIGIYLEFGAWGLDFEVHLSHRQEWRHPSTTLPSTENLWQKGQVDVRGIASLPRNFAVHSPRIPKRSP
ncbi:MAG: hypothetical protein DRJ09_10450 [Bacteroidetes bacterium]|nr:MAG: hypothetical protein DRJ09_10450 [Bacteroidota bacterium]